MKALWSVIRFCGVVGAMLCMMSAALVKDWPMAIFFLLAIETLSSEEQ